jgi:hypothetical protein
MVVLMASMYLTISPEAREHIREAREELLDALRVGSERNAKMFRANPTAENWRAWYMEHTAYRVAFLNSPSDLPTPDGLRVVHGKKGSHSR